MQSPFFNISIWSKNHQFNSVCNLFKFVCVHVCEKDRDIFHHEKEGAKQRETFHYERQRETFIERERVRERTFISSNISKQVFFPPVSILGKSKYHQCYLITNFLFSISSWINIWLSCSFISYLFVCLYVSNSYRYRKTIFSALCNFSRLPGCVKVLAY